MAPAISWNKIKGRKYLSRRSGCVGVPSEVADDIIQSQHTLMAKYSSATPAAINCGPSSDSNEKTMPPSPMSSRKARSPPRFNLLKSGY
eukprot:scaffold4385_cov162-Skeletonema_menzelii.AAC.3